MGVVALASQIYINFWCRIMFLLVSSDFCDKINVS